jgi:hypothetical protein
MHDVNKIFWKICVGQPRGVHDGGRFKRCSLYAQLKSQEILQEPINIIQGMKCIPFLIDDVVYSICTYLQKNWKTYNPLDVNNIRYDSNMNSRRVVIENAFGSLKNRWKILKHFDKTSLITIACCVFHNFCEMWGALEFGLVNARIRGGKLMGFGVDILPIVRKGKQAKAKGERLRRVLFEQ